MVGVPIIVARSSTMSAQRQAVPARIQNKDRYAHSVEIPLSADSVRNDTTGAQARSLCLEFVHLLWKE
jgi:hypothetical protein